MKKNTSIKIAYWRGVLIAPLAVLPATLAWTLGSAVAQFTYQGLIDAVFTGLFISLWGICIAYIVTATFGSLSWYLLWRFRRLSLSSLLAVSIIPSAITAITTTDIVFSLMVAYYSLAVAFSVWFVGLRHAKAITRLSNWRLFRRLFCGLTLRYHKKINSKAAVYSGVSHVLFSLKAPTHHRNQQSKEPSRLTPVSQRPKQTKHREQHSEHSRVSAEGANGRTW